MRNFILLVLCLCLLLPACRKTEGKAPATAPATTPPAYEKNWPLGEGEVRVRLDRTGLSIAEAATLTLTTVRPEGMELALSGKPESAGSLILRDERRQGPELAGENRLRETITFTLAPFLPGTMEIPPITVTFRPAPGTPGEPRSITTDPIALTATSVLPAGDSAPELREPDGPVGVPDKRWMFAAAALILAALLAAGLWYWNRTRKRPGPPPPPPVPPQVRAREALAALLAEGLLPRGEVKAFITRVSGILRLYIEERFGLAAPERTTEEFLNEVAGRGSFSTAHRLLLADFLSRCDLVKFAGAEGTCAEAEELVAVLRRFIYETEPSPEAAP